MNLSHGKKVTNHIPVKLSDDDIIYEKLHSCMGMNTQAQKLLYCTETNTFRQLKKSLHYKLKSSMC